MSTVKHQPVAGWQAGNVASVQRTVALGVIGDALGVGVRREELVGFAVADGVGNEATVVFAEGEGDGFQGTGVRDAGEDELGLEQGEEALGCVLTPAVAGLGEVLEADEDVEVLSAPTGRLRRGLTAASLTEPDLCAGEHSRRQGEPCRPQTTTNDRRHQ
jgi:hypothetical protein